MKTIQIDKEDEARLIEVLAGNGFEKYAERIKSAWSFYSSPPQKIEFSVKPEMVYWSGDNPYTVEDGKMIPFNSGEALPTYGLDGRRIN